MYQPIAWTPFLANISARQNLGHGICLFIIINFEATWMIEKCINFSHAYKQAMFLLIIFVSIYKLLSHTMCICVNFATRGSSKDKSIKTIAKASFSP